MLCVILKGRTRTCGPTTGGVSDIAIFDPNDLNFTQGALVAGSLPSYSAVAVRAGAIVPVVFLVSFKDGEAEFKYTRESGVKSSYTIDLSYYLEDTDQSLTNFLQMLDAAGQCCGIGIIVRMNSGKIFVAGERYVNGATIPKFKITQGGTAVTSGKAFQDDNGAAAVLTGQYSRPPYEYGDDWASIEALTIAP